jgi:hypothetical protein
MVLYENELYPADPGCADTSMPGRLHRLPHSEAHSAYSRLTAEPLRQGASESLFHQFSMVCFPFF